jgi:adenylate cyclase
VLTVDKLEESGVAVLEVAGEVDAATAPELSGQIEATLRRGPRDVLLDLAGVDFMDSSGVSALLNALTRMTRAGKPLALATPPGSAVLELLVRLRLDTTFTVFADANQALAWLRRRDGDDRPPAPAEASPEPTASTAQVARLVGVTPATLRRWMRSGAIGAPNGWTTAAIAQAKVVARLRRAGRPLAEISAAARAGRLATAPVAELLGPSEGTLSLEEAARRAGLKPAIAERIWSSAGLGHLVGERLTERDAEVLGRVGAVLSAGLPLVALLQVVRLYGQGLAKIADAEVRLFRLYVHEPLMAGRVDAQDIAQHMQDMVREVLPVVPPSLKYMHDRFVGHFIERDLLSELDMSPGSPLDVGRVRVAIAFADVVGYTRLTEERGEEEAVATVERLTEAVERTLPADARIIKTIGDEVMIVADDPAALAEWAVRFERTDTPSARLRIGMHYGQALYRDGDYYGREINLAARVVARAQPGKVVVTQSVAEASAGRIRFVSLGRAALKGFAEAEELFEAHTASAT